MGVMLTSFGNFVESLSCLRGLATYFRTYNREFERMADVWIGSCGYSALHGVRRANLSVSGLPDLFLPAFFVAKLLDTVIRGRLKRWAERSQNRLGNLLLE